MLDNLSEEQISETHTALISFMKETWPVHGVYKYNKISLMPVIVNNGRIRQRIYSRHQWFEERFNRVMLGTELVLEKGDPVPLRSKVQIMRAKRDGSNELFKSTGDLQAILPNWTILGIRASSKTNRAVYFSQLDTEKVYRIDEVGKAHFECTLETFVKKCTLVEMKDHDRAWYIADDC